MKTNLWSCNWNVLIGNTGGLSACSLPQESTIWKTLMRLAYTQGVLSNSHFVALAMFLMAEWQLRYSSAATETQSELADVEIRQKKCFWCVVRDFSVMNWWNSWDWKTSLKAMLPNADAQSGPPRSGCPGLGSWIYPRREISHPLTSLDNQCQHSVTLTVKKCFLMLRGNLLCFIMCWALSMFFYLASMSDVLGREKWTLVTLSKGEEGLMIVLCIGVTFTLK